jgi:uncharacterized protein
MKLRIDSIKDTPQSFPFEADEEWRRAAAETIPELAADGGEIPSTTLRAYRVGQDLLLEGKLEGALGLECSRCLTRYRHPLLEPFRLLLEPSGKRVPADPEAARLLLANGFCLGDELELGWFQGHELDLTPLFLEVVALAIPVQPLCREDCKGLCPQCGVDRNQSRCDCAAPRESSPFAVLESLKE